MLGGDGNDDFPIINSSSKYKLAKLFEAEPEEDVSLKYTPPKETKLKFQQLAVKPQANPVQLRVFMGRTVEAFKMENGRYKVYGKVGAALLGNEEQGHFQLYIYTNDERRITSADITLAFKFTIHENNYAIFHDRSGDAWSLHFEKSSDLADFSRQIILAKWRSSDCKAKEIVQDIVFGEKDKTVKTGDFVSTVYRVFPLSSDKQLCPELPKTTVRDYVDSHVCDVRIVGALEKSCRAIIFSHDNLGYWKKVVPVGCCLMLEVEIQQIISRNQTLESEQLDDSTQTLSNLMNRKQTEKAAPLSNKQNLVAGMAKMGHSVVPFPNFPSSVEPDRNIQEAENHVKLPTVKISDGEVTCNNSKEQETHSFSQTGYKTIDDSPDVLKKSMEGEIHSYPRDIIAMSAQFNVLFSEMRTSNAELRMNLTRIADKVDAVASKFETSTLHTNNKIDNVQSQLDKIMDNNNKMHSLISENFEVLHGSSEKILLSTKQPIISKNDYDENSEIVELKKRNYELEECLQAANTSSSTLQVKVQELNDHIKMNEKQKELMQQLEDIEKRSSQCESCKCHIDDSINLETSYVQAMETRNSDLEMKKNELENKIIHLDSELIEIVRMKNETEVKLDEVKNKYNRKIKSLEQELYRIQSECDSAQMKLTAAKQTPEKNEPKPNVTEIIKKLMNMTYKSLKLQLSKEGNDLSANFHNSLAYTLRMVTNNYLAQYGSIEGNATDNGALKSSAINPSLTVKSLGSDHIPHSSSDTSISPRSKSEALSSGSDSEIGNPMSFFPSNSPLPSPPDGDSVKKLSTDVSDVVVTSESTEKPLDNFTQVHESVDSTHSLIADNIKEKERNAHKLSEQCLESTNNIVPSQLSSNISPDHNYENIIKHSSDIKSQTHCVTHPQTEMVTSQCIVSNSPLDNSHREVKSQHPSVVISSMYNPEINIAPDSENIQTDISDCSPNKPPIPSRILVNKHLNNTVISRKENRKHLDDKNGTDFSKMDSDTKFPEISKDITETRSNLKSGAETTVAENNKTYVKADKVTLDLKSENSEANNEFNSSSLAKNDLKSSNITANNDTKNSDHTPYVIAPLISSEPPPFTVTPSPSPPNSPSPGRLFSGTEVLKSSDEVTKIITKSGGESTGDVWRPQPPPLFDDDDDDDDDNVNWLMS